MDIRLIQNFLMIAEEGSVTRAALRLNMSQPPLSRQLKQLEDELGVSLFERGKRKMQLTEEGYFLKNRGIEILELVKKTKDQIKEKRDGASGTISIGTIETSGAHVLPLLIARYKKKFPKVHFDMWNGSSDDIIERLDKELLDIGIVRAPFDTERYKSIYLPKEPWVILIHRDHVLAKNEDATVELTCLANQPLIIPATTALGVEINHWFKSAGITPNIFCVYNALMSAIVLVRDNMGVVICPSSAQKILTDDKLVYKEIVNPSVESQSVILWKKYKYLSSIVNNFLITAQEEADLLMK